MTKGKKLLPPAPYKKPLPPAAVKKVGLPAAVDPGKTGVDLYKGGAKKAVAGMEIAPKTKDFAKVKLDKPYPRIQTLILFLILTIKIR